MTHKFKLPHEISECAQMSAGQDMAQLENGFESGRFVFNADGELQQLRLKIGEKRLLTLAKEALDHTANVRDRAHRRNAHVTVVGALK